MDIQLFANSLVWSIAIAILIVEVIRTILAIIKIKGDFAKREVG